jgi:hypothetical protein
VVHDLALLPNSQAALMSDRFKEGNDYLGICTGLATGAVAFAIGLLAAPIALPISLRWTLVVAVVLLAIAIGCILLAKGAIIWRTASGTGSIDDIAPLTVLLLVILLVGCAAVAVVLVLAMLLVPDTESYQTKSAQDAIRVAMVQIVKKSCHRVDQLPAVVLIKGLDNGTARDAIWHVHVTLRPLPKATRTTLACPAAYDVFVDAKTGVGTLY